MKRSTISSLCVILFCVVVLPAIVMKTWQKIEVGKVAEVDSIGRSLMIETTGGDRRIIRVMVDKDTKLRVGGRDIPIEYLPEEVRVGDPVMVRFSPLSDQHAGRITKK